MESPNDDTLLPKARAPIGWTVLFLLLVAGIFSYPLYPSADLDASWRIALGYFFKQGAQFGQDVVFTYGPLGFSMGKTYSGLQFQAIVVVQLIIAVLGALVIIHEGRRLQGLSRWAFFLGFLLFGITYEDALHMLVIILMGFQLLRGDGGRWGRVVLLLALTVLASIKFTNLMLAALAVGVVVSHELWRKRWRKAALVAGVFGGGFVAVWFLCGQNPLNLPNYFRSSWSISQGYTEAMGFSTPWPPLWKAFVVLGAIGSYLLFHLRLNPDKPRALANAAMLAGFVFMNWKHGFVRADGHMIGFFFCAMLPLTAYPALLDDPPRWRRLHYAAFLCAGGLTLWGIESSLFGVTRTCLGIVQNKIWNNIEWTLYPAQTQQRYHDRLMQQREAVNLVKTRKLVEHASVDVLGYEQATAIFNDFNYQPRPVIQSYSVFTPYLAQLNGDFFSSTKAPEYVLLKIQTIDGRLPMMDDPEVWRLLPHRYDHVHTERGYQLWKRLPGQFDPAAVAPKLLQTTELAVGTKLKLDAYASKHLWARINLKQTLFGQLHAFLYKPPHVTLILTDDTGKDAEYYIPLSQGRAGFILSPIIEDTVAYASFANARAGREVRSLSLRIKPGDLFLFASTARVEISELPPSHTAERFFNLAIAERFHMFKTFPIQFEAHVTISEATVDDRQVVVLHAPSEMVFNLPPVPHEVSGFFGFLPGTYTKGGDTNGAVFIVYWSNGAERVELFRRFLDPVRVEGDRGLQEFKVDLSKLNSGRLYLHIDPGPFGNFAWDWTCWSDIEIK